MPFKMSKEIKLSFAREISLEVERLEKSFPFQETNWRCHFIASTNVLSDKILFRKAT